MDKEKSMKISCVLLGILFVFAFVSLFVSAFEHDIFLNAEKYMNTDEFMAGTQFTAFVAFFIYAIVEFIKYIKFLVEIKRDKIGEKK